MLRTDTKTVVEVYLKLRLKLGLSGSSEGQKNAFVTPAKMLQKIARTKNSRPPGICFLQKKIDDYEINH